jgi:hypothetical protein
MTTDLNPSELATGTKGRILERFGRFLHECQYPWPTEIFVQGGDHGLVLGKEKCYSTAFIEAFPTGTFIRGEGQTVAEAENRCWEKYKTIVACLGHEFERRGRTDGYAYCKHCAFGGRVLVPLTNCCVCGVATSWTQDTEKKWYCQEHADRIPADKEPEWKKLMAEDNDNDTIKPEDIGDVIRSMARVLFGSDSASQEAENPSNKL